MTSYEYVVPLRGISTYLHIIMPRIACSCLCVLSCFPHGQSAVWIYNEGESLPRCLNEKKDFTWKSTYFLGLQLQSQSLANISLSFLILASIFCFKICQAKEYLVSAKHHLWTVLILHACGKVKTIVTHIKLLWVLLTWVAIGGETIQNYCFLRWVILWIGIQWRP